jgi:hypothetical protein
VSRRDSGSAFATPGIPPWVKIGAGVIGVLVLAVLLVVLLSPSSPSQKATVGATLPPVTLTPSASSPSTVPRGSLDARGGIGTSQGATPPAATPGSSSPGASGSSATSGTAAGSGGAAQCNYDTPGACGPTTTAAPHGLRLATTTELGGIAADVPPPPGQRIDDVQISLSDETWGLLHVAAGGGNAQDWVLVHEITGRWKPVDSGYPVLACYAAAPASVVTDLAGHIATCA